jgi:heme/copper-type cytochrome/quinol oxidase subunit 2
MVVPSASESALHLHNCVSIAISGIVVPVVIVWVVPVIRIRIEERETKRVDKDERSIVETAEATKPIIPIEVAVAPTLKAGGGV